MPNTQCDPEKNITCLYGRLGHQGPCWVSDEGEDMSIAPITGPFNPHQYPPNPELDELLNKDLDATMDQAQEKLGEGADGGGLRLNAGKIRMDLTPPEWEWALADVTTQGSKKYAERNWELGMKWSTMVGCMKRHINKFLAGERYDGMEFDKDKGTTGCHHLAMVAWNALALMSYDLRKIGTNDLPKEVTLELLYSVNAISRILEEKLHDDKP